MKKVFKLFWSYNIIKIERYLEEMASKGYILKEVNTLTRVFTFEKTEPKNLIYKICYENKGVSDISTALKRDNWNKIINSKRWIFICNENKKEDIKINPSRKNLLNRNRNIKYTLSMLVTTYLIMFLPVILILGFSFGGAALGLIPVEYDDTLVVETSQIFFIEYALRNVLFIGIIFAIYTIIKLNKLDKQLKVEGSADEIDNDKDTEISNNDKIIKKIKFGWFYSPDKTMEWLENMESKGFNLYKTNKSGVTFYFKRGKPRKVKYVADYQNTINETYYEIHKEDGWKLNFKSLGGVMQWSIWSKEYDDIEPEIYTDNEELLKNAKKTMITHSIMFVPLLIIYVFLVISDIKFIINGDGYLFGTMIKILLLLEFGIFYKNILGYYLRTKKRVIS